jgi:hypothetical protein
MFTKRLLEKMSGGKREKVTRDWTNPHDDELHVLYCSLNIFHMINSWRMKPLGHAAHTGDCWKDSYGGVTLRKDTTRKN